MIPIAVSATSECGISVQAVTMPLTVAAATALLTPVATPNLMVMGPAGCRFGDYWKYGLPSMGLYSVVSVFLVPQTWSF